jgi:hypothetical protein
LGEVIVPYDSRSGSIDISPNEELVPEMAPHFIHMLRDLATDPTAPAQIKQDWAILQEWLGCAEHGLTAEHDQRVTTAWKGYLGRGAAPGLSLQPTFSQFRARHHSSGQPPVPPPPRRVAEVFDRLLATDEEIKALREFERRAMARSNAQMSAPQPRSTLRDQSLSVFLFGSHEGVRRLSVALAAIWGLLWLAYAVILQADLWGENCYYGCSEEVAAIWRATAIAVLGPITIAAAIRVTRWVYAGFRGQET